MLNPTVLEQTFQKYIQNLPEAAPDGILDIDIFALQHCGLLKATQPENLEIENTLSHYFHVLESQDKITLFNQEFVVWIVPVHSGSVIEGDFSSTSFVLLALNREGQPELEIVFSTTGIYNNSKFIISLIEFYIDEIKENEKFMDDITKAI